LNPPRTINSIYGYRTFRSKANPIIWKAANSYSNKALLAISIASFIIPFTTYLMAPAHTLMATIIGSTIILPNIRTGS